MLNFDNPKTRDAFFNLARQLYDTVSVTLLSAYNSDLSYEEKNPGDVITEVEEMLFEILIKNNSHLVPNPGFYGEESLYNQGLDNKYVWVVDPLDGTNNFAIKRPIFGSSIALLCGDRVVFGLLIDPIGNDFWVAIAGHGVWKNGYSYKRIQQNDADQRMLLTFGGGNKDLKSLYEHKLALYQKNPLPDKIKTNWVSRFDPLTCYISSIENKTTIANRVFFFTQSYEEIS